MLKLTLLEQFISVYMPSALLTGIMMVDLPWKFINKLFAWLIISVAFGWVVLEIYKRGG